MSDEITCTYIGHASTLTTIGESHLLTDPHLGRRLCGLIHRQQTMKIDPAMFPPLNAILISHKGISHLDVASFRYISSDIPVIVPERTAQKLGCAVKNPIIELSHWATHKFRNGCEIIAIPVYYPSPSLNLCRRVSNGYIARYAGRTVFFCGDSGYGERFEEIGSLYEIDLACLPIASYAPQFLMRGSHMTPAEALDAFADLKAKHLLPICWGTFGYTLEGIKAPRKWMEKLLKERDDLKEYVHLIEPGESFSIATKTPSQNQLSQN